MKINAVFASREPSRASVLLDALSRNGFSVTTAHRAKEVHGLLSGKSIGLLLLGQDLADTDGLGFLKALRNRPMTKGLPVIAVLDGVLGWPSGGRGGSDSGVWSSSGAREGSGVRQTAPLRLAFFNHGADECLTLDQDVVECLARIRAVLRRAYSEPEDEVVSVGEVRLNLTSYTLEVAKKPVPLTSKELDLLYVFLISPNRVLSRPYLIERVWGYDYFGSPRTVDVHVRRLRQKLGKACRFIQTVPCVGYKMNPEGKK